MRVSEAMTADVVTVSPHASLVDAARLMRDADIGPLPVCESGRVLGMLTDRDITVRAIASGKAPEFTRVADVMSSEVVSCLDSDDVRRAAEIMQSAQLRRLLVVNSDGRLAGIVSLGDLALQTGDEELTGKTLEGVSEPPPNK